MPPGGGIEVVFDASLRDHASLRNGIASFEGFARSPGTPLVAPLDDWSLEEARFAYATDAPVTLAEILAAQRARGEPCGVRAALETLQGVVAALTAARPAAQRAGLQAHGNLNPWRIAIREDGTPTLLGYGLPDVELFAYLDEQQPGVSIDTLRYAPPERLDDQEEDPRSDLYTLAVVAAEMMLGRPVFDGTPTSVAERVIRGDAPELIEAIGGHLGEAILDLLCVATELDRSERFASLGEFQRQAATLRGDGPTLRDLVSRTLAQRSSSSAAPSAEPAARPARQAEDRTLVPAVPPLPASPTLDQVRDHARAIVDRASQLTEQAVAMQNIAEQRAEGAPAVRPLIRRLSDAVSRAQKASSSTASTARLVELDDAVDDALITLEMVRSAETLCEGATRGALEVLEAIQSELDEARAEADLLERARRQADEAATRAEQSADEAESAATALEAAYAAGSLSTDGARERVATARSRAEGARSAARRARNAHHTSQRQGRGADAMRDADNARALAEEASQATAAIQRVAKQLASEQQDALDEIAANIRAEVARARSGAVAAERSLQRASAATAETGIPAIEVQLQALERYARAAESAAERCEREGEAALAGELASHRMGELEAALVSVRMAAELALSQSEEASGVCDRIVSRAGEAARHAAAVSKLRAEADALGTRLEESRSEVARVWSALETDTAEVTGRIARDAVQVAQRASEKVEELARGARTRSSGLEHSDDVQFLEERVADLRTAVDELEERARKAVSRCREARGAASRELEEIAERHREQRELEDAIDEARQRAERCRQAVTEAWEAYHETASVLAAAGLEGLDDLRVRAYEIIDIAEFQAGEADAAAAAATEQRDIHEARSHGSTAASFEERIREDLPEALQILNTIRSRATAEIQALEMARREIADALDSARDAVRAIEEMRVSGTEAARDWTGDPAVRLALDQLLELSAPLDDALASVQSADTQVRAAEDAASAQALVPQTAAAVRGLVAARERAEAISAALDKAVRTARAEIETRENATRTIKNAVETVRAMEAQLAERSERLFAAIERHLASSEPVRRARKRMRKAVDQVGEAHDIIARASRAIPQAPTASAAQQLQSQVEEQITRVERLLEAATEAESQGITAAEQEAADRVESERRRLTHARSSALSHLNTAKAAAAKSVVLMKESRDELAEQDDPAVRDLHDQAREWVRKARNAATTALGAARRCQRAATADEAMSHEAQAASLAADAHAAVLQARNLLQEAIDLARRQAEEAEALQNIKAEVQNIVATIADGVARAREHASAVVEVTAVSSDEETLATVSHAEDLLGAVKLAAAKIDAAAPMALEAESVEVAHGLLNTCRMALERVDTGIGELIGLVQRAQTLLGQEEERAATRLSDARKEAEAPAREARAIAEKAMGWVAAGERAADGSVLEGVQLALEALRREALAVGEAAARAEKEAAPAKKATDPASARGIGVKVERAAEEARQAAERTRKALDSVRSEVEAAAQLDRDAQQFRIRAAEAAAAAEICASDAAGVAEALEKAISESGVTDDEVATAFREVKRSAKAITTAAAQAFEQTESAVQVASLEGVQEATAAVEARRAEAERLLAELRKQDRHCRELLDTVKRKSRDEAKRSKDEALRARLRRKRNESTAIKREELRRQFLTERDEPEKPNLSELRERLRSRRRPEPPARESGPPTAGPRRLGDRPRRRRPPGDEDSRMPEDGASQMPSDGPSRMRPDERSRLRSDSASRLRADGASRLRRPEPDSSSRMRPEEEDASMSISGAEARSRSEAEREASRMRRLERRRQRDGSPSDSSEMRPRVSTSRRPEPRSEPMELNAYEQTQVGILAPDDLQEASDGPPDPRQGADALLRRLRRGRRED
ncbi:MAG: hypothetical protein H6734_13525 [Alphaproteobacteria bacterium]|nr:hypothetical protein [Alphaproteobacteria bacterium]